MQKSTLIEIIRSLNKKEVREINKWLLSPAHNHREDVVQLFDCVIKHWNKTNTVLEKEQTWAVIFPKTPYDDAFMRQIMYFLLKSIEEYLVFNDSINDLTKYQLSLMRSYRQRNLEKSYNQSHRIVQEGLQRQPLRDNNFLHNHFLIEQEYRHWSIGTQNVSANLQQTADALEKWFIAEKLHVSYAMLAHRSVYKTANYDEGMINALLDYVQKKDWINEPAIALYYYAYKVLTEPNEETHFDRLEQLLSMHESNFTASEFRTLYVAALNYCTAKINQGVSSYFRRVFELYKNGLEKGYLLDNNIVSIYTFGNTVAAAIKIGEFDWAEQFIQNFKPYLEEKQRNSIANFNLSRIYFEKKDYNKAQKLLAQFEYDDMLFNIIAKTMLLKIYYEQDEYDAFESLIESMRIYLQRKEALAPARKNSYKNMLSLMKKMLHLDVYNRKQREEFAELVRNTNPLAEREWLLKVIERG